MKSFYEIIKTLKTKPEKNLNIKKPKIIKLPILLISLFLILLGISLIFLTSHVKKSPQSIKDYQSQVSLSKPETTLETSQAISISKKSTTNISDPILKNRSSKVSVKIPLKASRNLSLKKELPETSTKSKIPAEESPIEGFILTKEDLLNNLLLIAEEERKKGNCEKAIFHYQNYLKEKKNPLVMNNYGACLIEIGKLNEAINIFNMALSIKNDPEIKYNLIIAYLKIGDKEKACKEVKNLDSFYQEKLKEFCK